MRAAAGTRDVPDGPGAARRGRAGRPVRAYRRVPHRASPSSSSSAGCSPARCPCSGRRGATCTSSTITFSTVAVGVYLVFLALKKDVRWIGLPLVTTVLLDLGLAVTVLYTDERPAGARPSTRTGCRSTSPRRSSAVPSSTSARSPRSSTSSGLVREQARVRRQARHASRPPSWSGCPPRRPSTSSRTASTPPSSRCGRSRSSRARSGRATRGAATGAGTPRRPGPSSPGSPTPPTCTPAPRPAGRAARPPTSR